MSRRRKPSPAKAKKRQALGLALKDAREKSGVGVQEAAEHLGVSRQTIWAWEGGEGEPDGTDLASLADFYGAALRKVGVPLPPRGLTLDQLCGREPLPEMPMTEDEPLETTAQVAAMRDALEAIARAVAPDWIRTDTVWSRASLRRLVDAVEAIRRAREALAAVVLTPDEDGGFVAECPLIPGCVSQGETREEALANICEAIDLCLAEAPRDA